MAIKDILEKIKSLEGGAELAEAVGKEAAALEKAAADLKSGQTASAREAEALKGKYGGLLSALGLEDDDKAEDAARQLKETLSGFEAAGRKPDEALKQMNALARQVETVTRQLDEMTKTAEAERGKRLSAAKTGAAVAALTKGSAASPENVAKLILENIGVKEDGETLFYQGKDKELTVEEGAAAWLKENAWAVKVSPNPGGGGSPAGGAGGETDPFLAGFGGNSK
jgi:DNA repair exonuclease SbcCD ATPase subunit